MPLWLFIALLAPFFYALVNHIDKYLIEKYFKRGEIGSLVIFSSLAGLPVSLLIAFFNPTVFNIIPWQAFLLMFGGMLFITAITAYFYALEKDETSVIAPLFQMIPVISFVLAYFFLGETLSMLQVLGSVLIMLGATVLVLEINEGQKIRIKKSIFGLMLLASTLVSIDALIFKMVTIEGNFWTSAFWEYLGFLAISIWLLYTVKEYRDQFFAVIKQNSLPVLSLNVVNEILADTGKIIVHYATLLAPLSLVTLISEGIQPVYVFALGVIITKFFPGVAQENLTKRHLAQKLIAIITIAAGTFLISL